MSDETLPPLPLAAEFPAADQAQWRKLAEAALKGGDFDKRLTARTYDGLRVEPLYPRAHARPVAGRPAQPWQVLQRVDHPDPDAAHAQVLDDLENGATGLSLIFAGSVGAYGYGLPADPDAIARVLDGVYLDGIAIDCELSSQSREAPAAIAKLVRDRKLDPRTIDLRAGYDPLGLMAERGASPAPWSQIAPLFAQFIATLSSQGLRGPFAVADGRIVHAAGGSEAQELAFAVANAIAYLRALEHAGLALADARRMIYFRLAADDVQFLTIAKFRALRKLWAHVEQACGLTPAPVFVAAQTAWRMMTQRDPWVNMLRATVATASAGIGGADAITALPFTAALGLPDAFARRVARNMQLVLIEESNLARVADPAAGSGAVEALTSGLTRAAWALVQEIEAAGGAAAAIEGGLLQEKVAVTRAAREDAVKHRKDAVTGTTDYPNLTEAAVTVLAIPRVSLPPLPSSLTFAAMPPMRLAAPFEALRDHSDALLRKTGARPKVFLANLGRLSDFTARATFARNFYEAGGLQTIVNDGFKNREEMVAAFKASGARLACLCSSDTVYAAEAVDTATALAAAGATLHLAGRPGENEAALRQAGINTFIYQGCDALATLQATHDILAKA